LDFVVSGMRINLLFIFLFVVMAGKAAGQTVIVNPDGTHTIVTGNVIVHPNGTHSVIHKAGDNSVIVGPDGRHTVVIGSKESGTKTIIHPDGRHSVVLSTGTNALIVSPEGTYTVIGNRLSLYADNLTQITTLCHQAIIVAISLIQ
jgi:hypothetical protein